jgi:hypothetical protein
MEEVDDVSDLFRVAPDGDYRYIPNSYDGIKDAIGRDTPFDFIIISHDCGYYIDDEGMLNGSPLNVPASLFAGRPIWGPVVLCAAQPDDEGDTLAPPADAVQRLAVVAGRWLSVTAGGVAVGQDINRNVADETTIPPARIIDFRTEEELQTYLKTGQIPDRDN